MKSVFVVLSLIASAQAFAVEYRAKPVTLRGEIIPSSEPMATELTAKIPVYQVYTVIEPVATTCNRTVCNDIPGNGTGGEWYGYFSAPRDRKASALARAIKGIGERTAIQLIEHGFFSYKPHSWVAFSNEINRAQDVLARSGYQGHFADAVLNQYGAENARNLGYYVDNACRVETYTCTVMTDVEKERFAYDFTRKVTVITQNQQLQDFERDTYTVTLGLEPAAVSVQTSDTYNRYNVSLTRISEASTTVVLNAISRNKIELPEDAGSARLSRTADGLVLSGQVYDQYMPSGIDSNSRLAVMYTVCRERFIGCKDELGWTEATFTGNSFAIAIPGSILEHDKKHKVHYKIIRLNSRYYSNQGYEKKTEAVKF